LQAVATEGYDVLTIRSVANVLGTDPSPLYAHIVNKADIDGRAFLGLAAFVGGVGVRGQQGPVDRGAELAGGLGRVLADDLGFDVAGQGRVLPGQAVQKGAGHVNPAVGQGGAGRGQVAERDGALGQVLGGPAGQLGHMTTPFLTWRAGPRRGRAFDARCLAAGQRASCQFCTGIRSPTKCSRN
jgi:hypothetical protein